MHLQNDVFNIWRPYLTIASRKFLTVSDELPVYRPRVCFDVF